MANAPKPASKEHKIELIVYRKKEALSSVVRSGTVWSGIFWSTRHGLLIGKVELNHGCSSISVAVNLSLGSLLIIDRIRHFAFEETVSGIVKFPRRIFENKAVGSLSWKGYRPTTIVYNMTPRLQMSAAFPE